MGSSKRGMGRRSLIRGAGGLALAIPFLPSLSPLRAQATEPPLRLVVFAAKFGVFAKNWQQTTVTPSEPIGQDSYRMSLMELGDQHLNKTLENRYRQFYPKINFIRGLDIPTATGHNTPGPLSCSVDRDSRSTHGTCNPIFSMPVTPYSFDAIMDERIYEAEPHTRAIRIAPFLDANSCGLRWLVMSARNNVGIPYETSLRALYNQLFADLPADPAGGQGAAVQTRQLGLVDRLLPDINRTLSSSRLSASDRALVQDYIDRIHELRQGIADRQIATCVAPPNDLEEVDGYSNSLEIHRDLNQIIVSAFACDLTRIAVVQVSHGTDNPRGTYMHPNSHHEYREPGPDHDATDLGYYKAYSSYVFDMIEQMDATVESNGKTMLDNSIILFTNTGIGDMHVPNDLPILTAGSGNGRIQTGNYLDFYRRPEYTNSRRPIGRPYNNLVTDIMRAFDLTPEDWETNGAGNGFGDYRRILEPHRAFESDRNHSLPGFLVNPTATVI